MAGFVFKGISSASMGLSVETVQEPMTAAVKQKIHVPEFRNGSIDFSALTGRLYYEDMTVEFTCRFKCSGLDEFKRKIKVLGGWLTGKGELVSSLGYTYAGARCYSGISVAPQLYGHYGEFNVSFVVSPVSRAEVATDTESLFDALHAMWLKYYGADAEDSGFGYGNRYDIYLLPFTENPGVSMKVTCYATAAGWSDGDRDDRFMVYAAPGDARNNGPNRYLEEGEEFGDGVIYRLNIWRSGGTTGWGFAQYGCHVEEVVGLVDYRV